MKKCSIMILNWNGASWLRKFLPMLIESVKANKEVELIVADNCSTDDSIDFLKREFKQIKLICFKENFGFAEGYNRAIDTVQTEYTILLNSDIEVVDGWIESLISYMDKNDKVAAAQPKILSYSSKCDGKEIFEYAGAAGGKIDCLGYPFCRGRKFATIEDDKNQYKTSDEMFWASGACMIIRTSLYKSIGGLDKNFFAHMEEIDLCWRLQLLGYRIACVTESKVYHVGGGTLNYTNPTKTFLNYRNNLLMLYKNLPMFRLVWVMFLRFWLDYISALQMLLTNHSKNAKAVLKARIDFLSKLKRYRRIRQNIQNTKVYSLPHTIYNRILLIEYYLLNKKC